MKTRAIRIRRRENAMHAAPRGSGSDRTPVVHRNRISREPSMCERCGAVYERKTWRSGKRATGTSTMGMAWTVCPACAQVSAVRFASSVRPVASRS